MSSRTIRIFQSGDWRTEKLSWICAGTYMTIFQVFCAGVSFGARTTNVPRVPVSDGPWGCSALTVACPEDSAGTASATAPAAATAAASAVLGLMLGLFMGPLLESIWVRTRGWRTTALKRLVLPFLAR